MQAFRFPHISRRTGAVAGIVGFIALLLTAGSPLVAQGYAMGNATVAARHTAAHQAAERSAWVRDGAWFQRLIYLYASGNAPIQRAAVSAGGAAGLSATQVTSISRAVRAAWVRMMTEDPASVGRTGVQPNYAGQQRVLAGLRSALARIAGGRYSALLKSTDRVYATTNSPTWLRANGLESGRASRQAPATVQQPPSFRPAQRYKTAVVYATSFCIMNAQQTCDTSSYVAVPDAYVKYASLGLGSSIPAIYQPYYLPGGQNTPPYNVRVATPSGTIMSQWVPVRDVGPWNEDDNWWDPTDTTTTLPSNCPVSATTVSTQSLTNAAVDGICPGISNWRRVYYYLLYQHQALPFFQPAAYQPSGTYRDATAWPPVLPILCPEAVAASVNDDGFECVGTFPPNYNGNAGAWLRSNSYDKPVLNQAAIDVSPGIDALLGWTYPSSGFIFVDAEQLP